MELNFKTEFRIAANNCKDCSEQKNSFYQAKSNKQLNEIIESANVDSEDFRVASALIGRCYLCYSKEARRARDLECYGIHV